MEGGAWQATTHGVSRVRHNLVTKSSPPPRHKINLSVQQQING